MKENPKMSLTRELAKKLGLVQVIHINDNPTSNYSVQQFNYLLVLDFESTCWNQDDEGRGFPEVIEFPVVLYDIKKSAIVEEFQQYVMPMERPKLSNFCMEFTGIAQKDVDNGVPLGTCLMLFMNWLKKQIRSYNLVFPNNPLLIGNKCAFVTWSNWDLGTCLKNECKRKRITMPEIFTSWIDLKELYKEYYKRRPKGLSGALLELGLQFVGREHCGLHDAQNTAHLTRRMITDGALIRITRTISN